MFKRIVILAVSGFAVVSMAQTSVSTQPGTATVSARPAHNCVRPEHPGRLATNNQQKQFSKDVQTYRECLEAFAKAQSELVKLHSEIGNSAIKEHNDYVTEMSKNKAEEAK